MTDDASPENLRKFLESDDPALRRMGLSLAKGAGVPEELLGLVAGLYMWHDDKGVRAAAKSAFMKHAPDNVKKVVLGTWKTSYRTLKDTLQPKVETMLISFKETPLDTLDVWKPALDRTALNWKVRDGVSIVRMMDYFGAEAVKPLIGMLGDWSWVVGESATDALVRIGKPAVEPLINVLGDKNFKVRANAPKALGQIGDARAVEPLIKALKDGNVSAAGALGDIGSPAVEPLIGVLSDDYRSPSMSTRTRTSVIGALGFTRDERAVEPLIGALSDDNRSVRMSAAPALAMIGNPRAIKPLIKALGDDYKKVRLRAEWALKVFGVQGLQGFITAGKGNKLTVSELKMILKEKKLPTSGTKALLIQRIMDA